MKRYIGVDLGGTKIAAACVDESGHITNETRMETRSREGAESVYGRIKQVIMRAGGGEPIHGIGVAVPGLTDPHTGTILTLSNIPSLDGFPLAERLAKEFGVSVQADNDANAATWGEYHFGSGKGADSLIFVTISTGIGGGIVLNGQTIQGKQGFAGELGHMVVDPEGFACGCGRTGCLEAVASGTAIARWAKEANPQALFFQYANEQNREVRSEDVFQAWESGDSTADEIIEKVIRYLGIGFANYIHIFNPERIVVGGGVSKAGARFFNLLRQQVEKETMLVYKGTFEIVPALLLERGAILGAAMLSGK
ncbi:ROK family protein [Thermoactinomyces sp. DSM 45892]|uniref:ROK family protein n=1 Tax=Thermoactinomyces sp. DSM 45892 TaxID=1882753 RepID=UPI00089A725C|nr:ROK family protein [Thermoactinomyces sp. DSM 45892]SDZ13782.1 glucokinase [Thermoactinomyces sp. DSM 45892]